MPIESRLSERRRQATLSEIKQVALAQLAVVGPEGLSLRAVARELGVTVQALYHYVDSRDALVTLLVADAHNELADAVAEAAAATRGSAPDDRIVALGMAYRRWAVDHANAFLLIYGIPLPDYAAPEGGPTTQAAHRLGQAVAAVLFDGWSAEELDRVPLPTGFSELEARLTRGTSFLGLELPPGALAFFLNAWAYLHGLIMLEVLHHVPWLGPTAPDLYRVGLLDLARRLQSYRERA